MQPYFASSQNERTIEGVVRAIENAILQGDDIIVVEYDLGFWVGGDKLLNARGDLVDGKANKETKTDLRIIKALVSYEKVRFIPKKRDDGSTPIAAAIKQDDLDAKIIDVCGVNLSCCVYLTAEGLAKKFPKSSIRVLAQAVNDSKRSVEEILKEEYASLMSRFKNVEIVR
jgi:hypothetical protein